ncbi:hypothetical protein BGZ63DRAFT_100015 [Mariannaea sp. PMI_226]|nr:hypothetical protein BGZ63DRAFT_100015 [Mariannaea sp. PMI_226]
MSTNGAASQTRQRAALACDVCRSRRTKCDGAKPACLFCEVHGIECKYRAVAPPTPSRSELEISAIKEHLKQISSILSIRPVESNSVFSKHPPSISGTTPPRLHDYPMDESIISRQWRREFPFMTIQTPSMMCFLGLSPNFAAHLVVAERNLPPLAQAVESFGFRFQKEDAVR